MSTRESRRLKEKRSIIPFGDIMLPVIGLVAVGLLIVGVKLFFLSGPKTSLYSPVVSDRPTIAAREPVAQSAISEKNNAAEIAPKDDISNKAILAVPASSSGGEAVQGIAVKKESPVTPSTATTEDRRTIEPMKKVVLQPTPSPSGSRWGVQIGSFSMKEGAETVKQQAAKAGYSAVISSALVGGKNFYRVTVPAGNERLNADALSEKLKKLGFPVFVVIMR